MQFRCVNLRAKVLRMLSEKRSTFSERRDQSGCSCSKESRTPLPTGYDTYPLDSDLSGG